MNCLERAVTRAELEGRAKGKIELVAFLIQRPRGNRNTEVQTQGSARDKEAEPDPEVVVVSARIEIVGTFVHEAGIVEDRETNGADDIQGVFRPEQTVGFSANRLAENVARTDITVLKSPQRIRAAQVPLVVIRDVRAVSEIVNDTGPRDQAQNLSLRFEDREKLGTAKFQR